MASTTVSETQAPGVGFDWRAGLALAGAAAALLLAWSLWQLTARPVIVTVDGVTAQMSTHRATVADLLRDLGLEPHASDRVEPALDSPVTRGLAVTVERARPVRVLADGRDLLLYTWGDTPAKVLADGDLALDTGDQVVIDGVPATAHTALPPRRTRRTAPTYGQGFAWNTLRTEPVQLRVYRAFPIVVHEGELPYTIRTTAQTVGEALRSAEVDLYLGDRVQPSLGSRAIANLHVYIQRSTPVAFVLEGRRVKTRTKAETVGDALADLGIVVKDMDRVTPPLDTELYDNIEIAVTRITEDVVIDEEIAPYETIFVPDPNLPIDTQEVQNVGANGITRTRYRVRYENGEEVSRVEEDTWVAQLPDTRRIAYGQQITPQTAVVDGQTITYWRKLRMYATSYHPAALGGDATTATGDRLTKGVVAVDPRIIPLRSQVFVPSYGGGAALDTGGGVRSRWIDLGYDDSNYVSWSRWVDVYLLWPPPSADRITWVVPNYPPVPN